MPDWNWPKHEDGRPFKVGEMSRDDQREAFKAAARKTQAFFDRPEVQSGLSDALNKRD